MNHIQNNTYPGRGIVVGKDTNNDVQNFNNLPKDVQTYVKNILNIQVIEQPKTNTINPSGMMGK